MLKATSAWFLWLCFVCVAPLAQAQGATQIETLAITGQPVLGPDSPAVQGWVSYVVMLQHDGESSMAGTVRISSDLRPGVVGRSVYAEGAFSLVGGDSLTLELPVHDAPPRLFAELLDEDGDLIARSSLAGTAPWDPLLFDLSVPSLVANHIGGRMLTTRHTPWASIYAAEAVRRLATSYPEMDPATGRPALPRLPAGYGSATVVMLSSEQLVTLAPAERTALLGWVLAGGALAVSVTRADDLESDILRRLVGGELQREDFQREAQLSAKIPIEELKEPPPDSQDGRFARVVVNAGDAVREQLHSYRGGNLRETAWGHAASYGLGEIHLLAFDPSQQALAENQWVQIVLRNLVAHAWDRAAHIVMPHANLSLDDARIRKVRALLDPNVGSIWPLVLAGLVLLVYAVAAGPLNFVSARKQGRSLAALGRLGGASLVAFVTILVIGVLGKGGSGTARHLSLIEAGAGMPLGSATRFRAFFASSASDMSVEPTGIASVLDVADGLEIPRTLIVDPAGMRIERFQTKPWQTVVVREDCFAELGAGVSMREQGGNIQIANHTGRDLVGVVVALPGGEIRYFSRIEAGATTAAQAGELGRASPGSRSRTPNELALSTFRSNADRDVPGLSEAWQLFEVITNRDIDWWPRDVPTLLAQLDGGGGHIRDSGLPVDIDQVLIRIVGFGGQL